MGGDFFSNVDRLRLPSLEMKSHPRALQSGSNAPPRRRQGGEFIKGPIPLPWLSRAAGLPGKAPLAVALAIRFEAGRRRSNEIVLTTAILERFCVNRKAKYRGLNALEEAKLVSVQRRLRRNPVVTILEVGDEHADGVAHRGVPGEGHAEPAQIDITIPTEERLKCLT